MTFIDLPSYVKRRDMMAKIKLLSPAFFLFLISLHYEEFLINAIKGNLVINSGIIMVTLYGVALMFHRLLGAQQDMRILDRFSQETLRGKDMLALLKEEWMHNSPMRQYLEPIAETGGMLSSQLDQNAIESELHALSEEYSSKLELPQFLVGFMIAMGLLGTFIGLLETLTGISGMLDGMGQSGVDISEQFTKLVVELRKPLSGMGMAFSASMFGLITSLMLSIMMINLRRYINGVMTKARNIMHDLTQRVAVPVGGNAMSILTEDRSTLINPYEVSKERDTSFNEETPNNISALLEQSQKTSAQISEGINALVRHMAESEKSVANQPSLQARIEESNSRVMTAAFSQIQNVLVESQKTSSQLAQNVDAMVRRMDSILAKETPAPVATAALPAELTGNASSMIEGLAHLQGSQQILLQRVIDGLIEIDQKFSVMLSSGTSQKSQFDQVADTVKRLTNKLEDVSRALGTMEESAMSLAPALDKRLTPMFATFRESASSQQQMVMKLEEMQVSNQNADRHLMSIKEALSRSASSFSQLDTIADNVSHQTVLLDASLEEGKNTQKVFVTVLRRELRGFLSSLAKAMGLPLPEETTTDEEKTAG